MNLSYFLMLKTGTQMATQTQEICHALMLKMAGSLLDKYGASFIITGEVLGQRPMSQTSNALKRVDKLSGVKGYILRPLSAKLMIPTRPEENGWVDREKLLDIQGRGRTRQIEYMKEFGLTEYPLPAGGCCLTEPNYSKRLRILKADDCFSSLYFDLIKIGRFFRLDKGKYIFVGRKEDENYLLSNFSEQADIHIVGRNIPGPAIVGIGDFTEDEENFTKELFARYSKAKGIGEIGMKYNGELIDIDNIDLKKLTEKIDKYLIF